PDLDPAKVEKMDNQQLKDEVTKRGLKITWSKYTSKAFYELCKKKLEWVEKSNKQKSPSKSKSSDTDAPLDPEKELNNLFKEIQSYWPKKPLLMKKYKKLKEKEEGGTTQEKKQKKDEKPKDIPKNSPVKIEEKKADDDKPADEQKEDEKKSETKLKRRRVIRKRSRNTGHLPISVSPTNLPLPPNFLNSGQKLPLPQLHFHNMTPHSMASHVINLSNIQPNFSSPQSKQVHIQPKVSS